MLAGYDTFAEAYRRWLSQGGLEHGSAALESVVESFPAFFGRDGAVFLEGYRRWLERQQTHDTEEAFAEYCEHRYLAWRRSRSIARQGFSFVRGA